MSNRALDVEHLFIVSAGHLNFLWELSVGLHNPFVVGLFAFLMLFVYYRHVPHTCTASVLVTEPSPQPWADPLRRKFT